jgi:hypothetical protein
MVHHAHLFILQIHTSSFEIAGKEKWCRIRRLSVGLWARMLQSLILTDALFTASWEKERKRENQLGGFLPREEHSLLAVLCGIFMAARCN